MTQVCSIIKVIVVSSISFCSVTSFNILVPSVAYPVCRMNRYRERSKNDVRQHLKSTQTKRIGSVHMESILKK